MFPLFFNTDVAVLLPRSGIRLASDGTLAGRHCVMQPRYLALDQLLGHGHLRIECYTVAQHNQRSTITNVDPTMHCATNP